MVNQSQKPSIPHKIEHSSGRETQSSAVDKIIGARVDTIKEILFRSETILIILIFFLMSITGIISPRFVKSANLIVLLKQSSYLVFPTLGQAIVLLTGGFDLSIGPLVSLISICSTMIMTSLNINPEAAILMGFSVGLLVGLIIGLTNGVLVALFRVNPLIVTLATGSVAGGLALILSGGSPVFNLPDQLNSLFGSSEIVYIPVPAIIATIITLIVYIFLTRTRQGKYLYAIGGNEEAARVAGIPTKFYLVIAYTMSAILAVIGGFLLTARVNSGEPNLGGALSLQCLAAAVLGGVSLKGGEGTALGAVLGAFFMILLGNAMDLLHVGTYSQMLALGLVLIGATVLDRIVHKE